LTPPNILVITLCSVRADHLGAWGYSTATTPTIDALANGGARFANAWSSATFTLPSHVTLLTGRWPLHAGVLSAADPLADDVPTLPVVLRHYGYRTVAWAPVASGASFRKGEGLERGFDQFIEGPSGGAEALAGTEPWFGLVHFKDAHPPYAIYGERPIAVDPRIAEWNTRRTSKELGATADAWFLAQLDPVLRAELVGLYDRSLGIVDERVAGVLKHVDLSRTIVVIAGDHGQALGDGAIGHQGLLLPEVLHVPLVIHTPGGEGREIAQDVGLVDVAPTLWELAGAVAPAGLDGRSLAPLLSGNSLPPRGVIAQAEVQGPSPWGGAQEVLVAGDTWLRYSVSDEVATTMRRAGDRWENAAIDPTELLADRARLSGAAGVRTLRATTDAERAALRKEGYW
jgi:arylsulfatase A-like enzyme